MTKMQELYEKVAGDSSLQTEFYDILGNAEKMSESSMNEKLISFAKDAGYDITLEEMNDFFRELAESKQGALSEAELDMVAGGKSGTGIFCVAASVVGVGLACGLASLIIKAISEECGYIFE